MEGSDEHLGLDKWGTKCLTEKLQILSVNMRDI